MKFILELENVRHISPNIAHLLDLVQYQAEETSDNAILTDLKNEIVSIFPEFFTKNKRSEKTVE